MTQIDTVTSEVIASLQKNIRPQDDLYRHVNGAWLDSTEIPADQPSTGTFINLQNISEARVKAIIEDFAQNAKDDDARKIADLYNSFMDEARIEGLGAGPLLEDLELISSAENKAELAVAAAQLGVSGVDMPFGITVDADRNNPSEYIAWIFQSGIGLPDESFYRSPEYAELLNAYKEFVPTLYSLALEQDAEQAKQAAEHIVEIETKIASSHFTAVEARDAEKTNNIMSREEFIASAPGFDWSAVFDVLGLTEQQAPKLLIYTPRALTGFAQMWNDADLEDLREYLRWLVIRARAPYLSDAIVQANFSFYGLILSGQEEIRERWKRGVRVVDSVLGEAVGKEFVARHFPPEYKAQMEQLVDDLLAAYRESITDLDWMTEETKEKALAKLSTFVTKIGYPNKWRDYSKLVITADDLVGNMRNAAQFLHWHELGKLGTPVDREEWHMNPQTVNAYYNPVANEIVFPAAILQPPFFNPEADSAWNYGGIGAVIGHEIGHGFDDQGSKYDGEGKLNNWWTERDREEFEKRTKALVDQYEAYVPAQFAPDSPFHVQGELTLGENIGDLGGLSIALKAYNIAMKRAGYASSAQAPQIEGYNGIQRVLLAFARIWQDKRRDEAMVQSVATDPHSPAEFRCNGVIKNVDAFAEQFDVREGDALYLAPEDRVRIW
ncbi:putative endopeptidase [Arcanobacterium pluranimalium]|uniref:M13 family metallopeptidase n=1 Tax=Arcanobacterium pluranimalium TaxID=108028 RepID=UPI00195EEB96|nr:M13-type metalloendopeptidase [Arcanobacterium pluranimalium]MBM7825716.1 putative endopeptidase [Arcanobacterium pluranimalium]